MLEKLITLGSTGLVINDRTKESLAVSPFYHIRVSAVDGHFGTDRSIEAHPIPGKIGDRRGDNFKRGKTITLTGTIQGRNLQNLREGQHALEQAFWTDATFRLRFTEWHDLVEIYYNVYVSQDLSMVDKFDRPDEYRAEWII